MPRSAMKSAVASTIATHPVTGVVVVPAANGQRATPGAERNGGSG